MADHHGRPFKRLFEPSQNSSRFNHDSNYLAEQSNSFSQATKNFQRTNSMDHYQNNSSFYSDYNPSSGNRSTISQANKSFQQPNSRECHPKNASFYSEYTPSAGTRISQATNNFQQPYSRDSYPNSGRFYSEYNPLTAPKNITCQAKNNFQQPNSTDYCPGNFYSEYTQKTETRSRIPQPKKELQQSHSSVEPEEDNWDQFVRLEDGFLDPPSEPRNRISQATKDFQPNSRDCYPKSGIFCSEYTSSTARRNNISKAANSFQQPNSTDHCPDNFYSEYTQNTEPRIRTPQPKKEFQQSHSSVEPKEENQDQFNRLEDRFLDPPTGPRNRISQATKDFHQPNSRDCYPKSGNFYSEYAPSTAHRNSISQAANSFQQPNRTDHCPGNFYSEYTQNTEPRSRTPQPKNEFKQSHSSVEPKEENHYQFNRLEDRFLDPPTGPRNRFSQATKDFHQPNSRDCYPKSGIFCSEYTPSTARRNNISKAANSFQQPNSTDHCQGKFYSEYTQNTEPRSRTPQPKKELQQSHSSVEPEEDNWDQFVRLEDGFLDPPTGPRNRISQATKDFHQPNSRDRYPKSGNFYSDYTQSTTHRNSISQAANNFQQSNSIDHCANSGSFCSGYTTEPRSIISQPPKALKQTNTTVERKEEIRDQFVRLEGEFLKNWSGNSYDKSARMAFVDHLILLKQEATEQIKEKYQKLLETYKINNKFESYVQVSEYLECRVDLQNATGVYIPNIAEPDFVLSAVWKNNSMKSLSELKRKNAVRLRRKINVQKDILFQSRCAALGIALANRDPKVKERLYTMVKGCCYRKSYKCDDPKNVLDFFQIQCGDLVKNMYKSPKSMWADPDILMEEMISSILNLTAIKSLTSIYSPSYANINSMEDFKAIAFKPITPPEQESSFKRERSVETEQTQSVKKIKVEDTTDCDDINTSLSSNEREGIHSSSNNLENCDYPTILPKVEDASYNSTTDPDLMFIEDLIKKKEKVMKQLIQCYNRDIVRCHVSLTKNTRFNKKDWRLLSIARDQLFKNCGILRPHVTPSWTHFDLQQFLVDESNIEDKNLRLAFNSLKTTTVPSHIRENVKQAKQSKAGKELGKKILLDLQEYGNQMHRKNHFAHQQFPNPFKWVAKNKKM